VLVLLVAASSGRPPAGAQLTYTRGQTVSPAYEGWERDAQGKLWFLFGYMNRNWLEELDVPIGEENSLSPGPADQGQPTHFLPRRNRFVFRVPVPEGFGDEDEMIWTLVTKGETKKAYATLRQDYFVDDLVKASEQGAIGAGTSDPVIRANKAPELQVEGPAQRITRVGEPITLIALATDDGVPPPRNRRRLRSFERTSEGDAPGASADPAWTPPRQVTVGSATGLRLSWYVYRGAGEVQITPDQNKVWEDTRTGANSPWAPRWEAPPVPPDGRWVAQATFREPGTYVLRCLASDGALGTDSDVTVTVLADE
jgi:hypothetical protein